MLKVNSTKDIEPITIRIDKVHTPIAFATKVEELVENGMERAEAEKMADGMGFECEIMYHKGYGIFAMESEPLNCIDPYSPYNGEMAVREENN